MNPYIEIIRFENSIMAAIAVLLMAIVDHTYTLPMLIGAVCVFISTGAGNTINDYYDYEIDKINKPERPIPSGRISRRNALLYSIILIIIAIILGYIISIEAGTVVVICLFLEFIYARNLKEICFVGNFIVSLLTGLTFVFGGIINQDIRIGIILGLFAFLMTLSREIIKDCEDIEGDLKENARTFPIVFGVKNAIITAVIFNIATCILSPLLYLSGLFSIAYMIIVLVADIIFIYSAILSLKDQSKENLHKISTYMKIAMFIAFISFAIGSLI